MKRSGPGLSGQAVVLLVHYVPQVYLLGIFFTEDCLRALLPAHLLLLHCISWLA